MDRFVVMIPKPHTHTVGCLAWLAYRPNNAHLSKASLDWGRRRRLWAVESGEGNNLRQEKHDRNRRSEHE